MFAYDRGPVGFSSGAFQFNVDVDCRLKVKSRTCGLQSTWKLICAMKLCWCFVAFRVTSYLNTLTGHSFRGAPQLSYEVLAG